MDFVAEVFAAALDPVDLDGAKLSCDCEGFDAAVFLGAVDVDLAGAFLVPAAVFFAGAFFFEGSDDTSSESESLLNWKIEG